MSKKNDVNRKSNKSTESDLVYGIHAVDAAIASGEVEQIFTHPATGNRRLDEVLRNAEQQAIAIEEREKQELDDLTGNAVHQGIVARLRAIHFFPLKKILAEIDQHSIFLILDGVQDPHNVGACLRTAEAAGVSAVILPKDRACPINATVRKVSSGAAFRLPLVQATNLARAMEELKQAGAWLIGLAGEAHEDLYHQDFTRLAPVAVVMGSEGQGLRKLTRDHCDLLVHIPMTGGCGSLNVSVATGISLFEIRRQINLGEKSKEACP